MGEISLQSPNGAEQVAASVANDAQGSARVSLVRICRSDDDCLAIVRRKAAFTRAKVAVK